MAPHRFCFQRPGKRWAALAALVLTTAAQPGQAAPPDGRVVTVAFDPAALHARDLEILEGKVRAALPPSDIEFSESRTTIAMIADRQADARFIKAVRTRLAGQQAFVMRDRPVTIYRLKLSPEVKAPPGRDGEQLAEALGLVRPLLPGVSIEDAIDAAVVRADDARIAPTVADALNHVNITGLAVTRLTPTSWRVTYDAGTEKMLSHEPSKSADLFKMLDLDIAPGRALLMRLSIGELLRHDLRDPVDFGAELTSDGGAKAWVVDPEGRYGERLKQALVGEPYLTVSSAPGEFLTVTLSAPPPESSSAPDQLPEVDQLFAELLTLADGTRLVRGVDGVVVQIDDDATLRKRVHAALAEAGLAVETQPDQSLKVMESETRNLQPEPAALVATVEARARALGVSGVAATPTGALRVEARFQTQAAADAFRRNIRANSTGFAIRVVDDGAIGDDNKTPPSPNDESLPQREGERLWVKPGTPITGAMIKHAVVVDDPQTHSPAIEFQLSSEGAAAFAGLSSANVGSRLAIVLDGVILTAPVIMNPMTRGQGEIDCDCSLEEAQKLATAMMAHPADLPLKLVETPGE